MVVSRFPPLELASPEGLLAMGGDLDVETLKLAYESGIFPWPTEDYPLLWFAPPRRAILEFQDLKIPKRLFRELKVKNFHHKIDTQFMPVLQACAEGLTRNSRGTWITPEMQMAYRRFHEAGYAHSFETYNASGQLVGGLYGVSLGKMFAGESMFFWESGASKAALLFACKTLASRGCTWMDIQTLSPLLQALGAKEIPRKDFMKRLTQSLKAAPIFPLPNQTNGPLTV